jgi:taurine--2-oxoglutarate transaminase
VFFTLGGADANENAVKIARQASRKPRGAVIARDRSYHGATHLAMALSGDSRTQAQVDAARSACSTCRRRMRIAARSEAAMRDDAACARRSGAPTHRRARRGARRRGGDGSRTPAPTASSRRTRIGPRCVARPRERGVCLIADEGDERVRPLRRMVRVAAPWRSRPPDLMTLAKGLTGAACRSARWC